MLRAKKSSSHNPAYNTKCQVQFLSNHILRRRIQINALNRYAFVAFKCASNKNITVEWVIFYMIFGEVFVSRICIAHAAISILMKKGNKKMY